MQSRIKFEDASGWEDAGEKYHLDQGCTLAEGSFFDHSNDEEITTQYCQKHHVIIEHK